MSGRLIVLEGIDGSGKSTQTQMLCAALASAGRDARHIKFPDYADPSSELVRMYLRGEFGAGAGDVNAYAASTFYAVDRYASYRRHWEADYLSGRLIVTDRYASSNIIHQSPKLPRDEWEDFVRWAEDFEYEKLGIPRPDLVIYLYLPAETARQRLACRSASGGGPPDIHERDLDYLRRCAQAADWAAQKLGWATVKCAGANSELRGRGDIHSEILSLVSRL